MEHVAILEKDLERAREDVNYYQSQESAGCAVLTRHIQECNKLKEENKSLSEEKKQRGMELEQVKS